MFLSKLCKYFHHCMHFISKPSSFLLYRSNLTWHCFFFSCMAATDIDTPAAMCESSKHRDFKTNNTFLIQYVSLLIGTAAGCSLIDFKTNISLSKYVHDVFLGVNTENLYSVISFRWQSLTKEHVERQVDV